MLRAVLTAGNALNVGTSHAGALGFNISSTLQKLANLKVRRVQHHPQPSENPMPLVAE